MWLAVRTHRKYYMYIHTPESSDALICRDSVVPKRSLFLCLCASYILGLYYDVMGAKRRQQILSMKAQKR